MDDGTGHLVRPSSIIGMGAYGTVFRASRLPKVYGDNEEMWSSQAKAVAVKETVFTEVADDITVVLKEVSYLSNLQHPNIVSYFTAFTSPGVSSVLSLSLSAKSKGSDGEKARPSFSDTPSLCIVEELVEGASVAKVIKMTSEGQLSKSMSEAEIAAILYDVLQALLYIHEECRLVHRDIKPLNMLLDRKTNSVKLCDFGTCADMSEQSGRYTVIGTIGWIAPEVLDSGMRDFRSGHVTSHGFPSDVWSLGVSALEMALPHIRRTALSEYIKDISASPCSVQPTVETSRKVFLHEKLSSEHLRDFIACCLRKDPSIRLTVRGLLSHPFIVGNGVTNARERMKKISAILTMVKAASKSNSGSNEKMVDDAIVLPQYGSSTMSKSRCMEAIAAIKREFFADQTPLMEKTHTSHYTWCLPEHLSQMLSSDDYRYMPTPTNMRGAASSKPIFDAVVLPATVEAKHVVLNIMRKYRKLCGAKTVEGLAEADDRHAVCYTLSEMACENLKHERFIQLHDDLLRRFKAACMAIPDFDITCLSNFLNNLTDSDADVHDLRQFVAYIAQLQKEDLMHTHRTRLEVNDPATAMARNLSGGFSRTSQPMMFATPENLLRFPQMPQSLGFRNANTGEGSPPVDSIRKPEPLVNPSAYLFNTWLKRKQADMLSH